MSFFDRVVFEWFGAGSSALFGAPFGAIRCIVGNFFTLEVFSLGRNRDTGS